MDQFCCLLGLCCPPLERQERVTKWFCSWGAEEASAAVIARELIKALDDSPLGHFLKSVAKH